MNLSEARAVLLHPAHLFPDLPERDQKSVVEMAEVGEIELALDVLVTQLYEFDIALSLDQVQLLVGLDAAITVQPYARKAFDALVGRARS